MDARKYTKSTESPMIPSSNVTNSVNFVNNTTKSSIDLYYGHSTKDLAITSTSSYKNYKNTHTDSLNVKNYKSWDVQENRKLPENKNSGNGTTDFTVTLSSS